MPNGLYTQRGSREIVYDSYDSYANDVRENIQWKRGEGVGGFEEIAVASSGNGGEMDGAVAFQHHSSHSSVSRDDHSAGVTWLLCRRDGGKRKAYVLCTLYLFVFAVNMGRKGLAGMNLVENERDKFREARDNNKMQSLGEMLFCGTYTWCVIANTISYIVVMMYGATSSQNVFARGFHHIYGRFALAYTVKQFVEEELPLLRPS